MNERMPGTQSFLARLGLPIGDAYHLPNSAKRFPDGAEFRLEIPSVEGPKALAAILEESERLKVSFHRVSQGSGADVYQAGPAQLARHLPDWAALGEHLHRHGARARSPGGPGAGPHPPLRARGRHVETRRWGFGDTGINVSVGFVTD
jgi:hypothetical protein